MSFFVKDLSRYRHFNQGKRRLLDEPLDNGCVPSDYRCLMEIVCCPTCDVAISRREAGEGWCEACGSRLPAATRERAAASMRRVPCSRRTQGPAPAIETCWRGWGLLCLLVGAVLSYLFIYAP